MAPVLIRQFDVYENTDPASAEIFPFLVVLQSDAVDETSSVIAAPLVERPARIRAQRVQPVFLVAGRRLALILTDMATVPRSVLKRRIANLQSEHDRIMSGLDLIFIGY